MRSIFAALLALAVPACAHAMSSSTIPTKIPVYWAQTATSSFSTCPIPTPSQISITAGRASWTDGFPPLTFLPAASGGIPPFGDDFNGALCQISQWTRWLNAGAAVPYDATFQSSIGGYPKGAVVPSLATFGIVWLSTVENNTSDPDTGGAGWQIFTASFSNASITGATETYSASQCGSVISRSNSGAAMLDTLPGSVAGVLPANCTITIINTDVSGLYAIAAASGASISGGPTVNGFLYLGPGQSLQIGSNASNYLSSSSPTLVKLGANSTIFYSLTGNDTANNGILSTSPFLTPNHAYLFAQTVLNLNGFVLTIQAATSSNYSSLMNLSGTIVGQVGPQSVIIQGDIVNSSNPNAILTGTNGQVTINGDNGAKFQVQGFTFSGGLQHIRSAHGAVVSYQTDNFGNTTGGGSQVTATAGGTVEPIGNYSISGNAGNHFNANANGVIHVPGPTSPLVTLTGSPNFINSFVIAQSNGTFFADFPISFSGGTTTGSVRFSATLNGVINTGGGGAAYFPGTVAGSTNFGGQYN